MPLNCFSLAKNFSMVFLFEDLSLSEDFEECHLDSDRSKGGR